MGFGEEGLGQHFRLVVLAILTLCAVKGIALYLGKDIHILFIDEIYSTLESFSFWFYQQALIFFSHFKRG